MILLFARLNNNMGNKRTKLQQLLLIIIAFLLIVIIIGGWFLYAAIQKDIDNIGFAKIVAELNQAESAHIQERERNRWPKVGSIGYLCYKGGMRELLGILALRPDLMEVESCRVVVREITGSQMQIEHMGICVSSNKYEEDRQWIDSHNLSRSSCE
uniref:Uncharacterized protein n=1 Tax=Candidatus Kentrum sp. TC TaxID=2126339 RepID=A0A450YLJ2_9GAMM|nr:MAG: hypothetical protein BECKTC1821E_GA0114239_101846 [Candidatus Kentron sp. TC]